MFGAVHDHHVEGRTGRRRSLELRPILCPRRNIDGEVEIRADLLMIAVNTPLVVAALRLRVTDRIEQHRLHLRRFCFRRRLLSHVRVRLARHCGLAARREQQRAAPPKHANQHPTSCKLCLTHRSPP